MGPPKNTVNTQTILESGDNRKPESSPDARNKMKTYWEVYTPTLESMMLCHDAPTLAIEEQEELMSYLPKTTYYGKNVLELGAGIGRYTTLLSDGGVKNVTAVDFMESYHKENEKINGKRENVTLLHADATKLNFSPASFDMVFSNWLLMYLTDNETNSLFQRALSWLKPGGYLFFRESCYHQSGNVKRAENPTLYRSPLAYMKMVQNANDSGSKFQLIQAKNIQTYVKHYGNPNQLCFLVQKSINSSPNDANKSVSPSINVYESLYGASWVSNGGKTIGEFLSNKIGSLQGKTVLDANSGTGGLAFLLAQKGALRVHGISPSHESLHFTLKNQSTIYKQSIRSVSFECVEQNAFAYNKKYDYVILNGLTVNSQTEKIILKLKEALKDQGRVLFTAFTSETSNDLPSSRDIVSILEKVNFKLITTSDETEKMATAIGTSLSEITDESSLQVDGKVTKDIMGNMKWLSSHMESGAASWSLFEASL